jgi:hypothetical protein
MATIQGNDTTNKPITVRVLMFDVSPSWASFLYDIFNLVLFAGAVAVAIGTYGSIKMGAVKERFSDIRIAENEAETARANEAAAQAKEGAAKAAADVARANERAELARLETEKIKQQIAWRELSSTDAAKLAEELSKQPGSVTLIHMMDDPESFHLMQQFGAIFLKARWKVGIQSRSLANQNLSGILIVDRGTAETKAVVDAFSARNISFAIGPLPPAQAWQGSGVGSAAVLVGTKPMPNP